LPTGRKLFAGPFLKRLICWWYVRGWLGPGFAIQRVAAEIRISQPELADELDIVIAETRAGIDRHKALQRMVERTGVEDIKRLVSTLTQSMRLEQA